MRQFLKLFRSPEVKASRTARLIAFQSGGRARWTPRDYAALAREGFISNAVVHRAIRLVAENAAAVPYLVYEGAAVRDTHPLTDLLARPNPRQEGAAFREALCAHLLIAGNAYVEAVALEGAVRELYALRPDRMRAVPGADGWPEAYEYVVGGRTMRFEQNPPLPPILHLTQFHPLDDHYGLASIEPAAMAIESRVLTAPPASPAEGDCYIPAAGATGAWSGWDLQLALASGGGWIRIVPKSGMKAWLKSERATVTYEDGTWRDGVALTAHGGRVTLRAKEEELTLSGAFVETADTAFIPDRAIVLGVSSRTTQAITGATSYDVGISGEVSKFGGLLGIALNSTNVGVIGPTAFYADTKVRSDGERLEFHRRQGAADLLLSRDERPGVLKITEMPSCNLSSKPSRSAKRRATTGSGRSNCWAPTTSPSI